MPNIECHICNSTINVRNGEIEHNVTFGGVMFPGTPRKAKWLLCERCIKTGWDPAYASDGVLIYSINKRKSVQIS